MTEASTIDQSLTFSCFGSELGRVGVDARQVEKVRVTVPLGTEPDRGMQLEVTVFCTTAEGKHYIDAETHEVAREVRRFPLAALHIADPTA